MSPLPGTHPETEHIELSAALKPEHKQHYLPRYVLGSLALIGAVAASFGSLDQGLQADSALPAACTAAENCFASSTLEHASTTTVPILVPLSPRVAEPSSTVPKAPPSPAEAAPPYSQVPLPSERFYQYEQHAQQYLLALPSLSQAAALTPESTAAQQTNRQEAYITQLGREVAVTPTDYANFTIDQSYRTAFDSLDYHNERILPQLFVVHWTAERFPGGVTEAINFMKNRSGESVDFYIDRAGNTYQLMESDYRKPGHAWGVNTFSQGVEVEANGLLDYMPLQIKQIILLAVTFCRRNKLPVGERAIIGHYAADLIFDNPYYDPASGTFSQPKIGKYDPPQELMNLIIAKAAYLNAQLGPPSS